MQKNTVGTFDSKRQTKAHIHTEEIRNIEMWIKTKHKSCNLACRETKQKLVVVNSPGYHSYAQQL